MENNSVGIEKVILAVRDKFNRVIAVAHAEPASGHHEFDKLNPYPTRGKILITLAAKMIKNPQWRKAIGNNTMDYIVDYDCSQRESDGVVHVQLLGMQFQGLGLEDVRTIRFKKFDWFATRMEVHGYLLHANRNNKNRRQPKA